MRPRFSYVGLELAIFMAGWVMVEKPQGFLSDVFYRGTSLGLFYGIVAILAVLQAGIAYIYLKFWRASQTTRLILGFALLFGIFVAYGIKLFSVANNFESVGLYLIPQIAVFYKSTNRQVAEIHSAGGPYVQKK